MLELIFKIGFELCYDGLKSKMYRFQNYIISEDNIEDEITITFYKNIPNDIIFTDYYFIYSSKFRPYFLNNIKYNKPDYSVFEKNINKFFKHDIRKIKIKQLLDE